MPQGDTNVARRAAVLLSHSGLGLNGLSFPKGSGDSARQLPETGALWAFEPSAPNFCLLLINNNLGVASKNAYHCYKSSGQLGSTLRLGGRGKKQTEKILTQSPQIPSRLPLLTDPGCLKKRRRRKNEGDSVGSAWSAGEYCLSVRDTGSSSGRSMQQEII